MKLFTTSLILFLTTSAFAANLVELEPGAKLAFEADKPTEVYCKAASGGSNRMSVTIFEGVQVYAGSNCDSLKEAGKVDSTSTYEVNKNNSFVCNAAKGQETYYLAFNVSTPNGNLPRAIIRAGDFVKE